IVICKVDWHYLLCCHYVVRRLFLVMLVNVVVRLYLFLFFFNPTATAEIYTLSLHDALPICGRSAEHEVSLQSAKNIIDAIDDILDRKSTRLNSSHRTISYAVFCLKKKKQSISKRPEHLILTLQLGSGQRAAGQNSRLQHSSE